MSPATRARRIARVHQLTEEGHSSRVIAKKVGVSEATVRRWRRATSASDDASPDAPECATGASPAAQECVTGASSDAAGCVTAASSPASEPDQLTVPYDADLRDHLAVLAEAGVAPVDAVTRAVELLADAYRTAWDYGLAERGHRPEIRLHVKGLPPPDGW